MHMTINTNITVIEYYKRNTDVEITDLFKFLYQSCFGCEHLVSDYASALERILNEAEYAQADDLPNIEYLDGPYCRVHLKTLKDKASLEKLCQLFLKSSSAQSSEGSQNSPVAGVKSCPTDNDNGTSTSRDRLENELENLILLAGSGEIPFSPDFLRSRIDNWRSEGFPAVHHSDTFRNSHNPAYRVINKDYLKDLL